MSKDKRAKALMACGYRKGEAKAIAEAESPRLAWKGPDGLGYYYAQHEVGQLSVRTEHTLAGRIWITYPPGGVKRGFATRQMAQIAAEAEADRLLEARRYGMPNS